jgi:poly-gamma-glutamate capsule biosynthesis protein CapA/YwtB (metallophosphatase superfamily)
MLVVAIALTLGVARVPANAQAHVTQSSDTALKVRTMFPPDPLSQIPRTPIPSSLKDGFTFAAVGDLIGPGRPVVALKDPELEKVSAILQHADVAFANNEGGIFDLRSFTGYPAAENGGGDPVGVADVAKDLREMGIRMVSKANNHATDWGIAGLQATERVLDEAGIVHAGSGRNRAEARAPAYLESSSGRIALVATASTFTPMSMAGAPEGEAPGRPGISVLRTRLIVLVTPAEMTSLRRIAADQGEAMRDGAKDLHLMGQIYREAAKPGVTYEMNPYDEYEILKSIRGAKQTSDFTVFSIHAHESGIGGDTDPADFQPTLFHRAVDAGADMVIEHGPHVLRGIEIYKNKPIFYGFGSFFYYMEEDRAPVPDRFEQMNLDPASVTYIEYLHSRFRDSPSSYESVIAVSEFQGGMVKEIRLYPLDLRYSPEPTKDLGIPRLASPELGKTILNQLQRESKRFGTEIRIENNIGIIRVNR